MNENVKRNEEETQEEKNRREFDEDMKIAERVMDEDREVLASLADS